MTVKEVIMTCCKDNDMSLSGLAAETEMNQGNLSHLIGKENGMNMKVSTFLKLVEAAGGGIVVKTIEERDLNLDGLREYVL